MKNENYGRIGEGLIILLKQNKIFIKSDDTFFLQKFL